MRKMLCGLLSLTFVSFLYGATIYRWVDKDGGVHFTEDYNAIPDQYRSRVETKEEANSPRVETPTPSFTSPQKGKEPERDVHGTGENYWRAKVRPWKDQLKQGKAECEDVDRRMGGIAADESGKSLSRTQLSMGRAQIRVLMDEKSKCEARIDEANEMLEKIQKEANEANANPEWLK